MSASAILLLAHGSKDPKWKLPFAAILESARGQSTKTIELAFLESMSPDFDAGIDLLVDAGAREVRVIPLFLAAGSHVRADLPRLIEQAMQRHPNLRIDAVPAIGEIAEIQQAIAAYAVRAS